MERQITEAVRTQRQHQKAHALALVMRWQDHRDYAAREELAVSHIPLVLAVVNTYPPARRFYLEDAKNEGMIGLLHAMDKFDRTKSDSFGFYAKPWIRHEVRNFLFRQWMFADRSKIGMKVFSNMGRAERELYKRGLPATPDAIAEFLELDPKKVANALALLHIPTSLDVSLSGGNGMFKDKSSDFTLMEVIANADASLEDQADDAKANARMHAAIAKLSPREQQIVIGRFTH